jgi:hypothetical protein
MPIITVGELKSAVHMRGGKFIARTTIRNVAAVSFVFRVSGVRLGVLQIMRDRFAELSTIALRRNRDGTIRFHIALRAWAA